MKTKEMRTAVPEFQLKQDLLSLLKKRKDLARRVFWLKNTSSYKGVGNLIRNEGALQSFFQHTIFGNHKPESYKDLGGSDSYYFQSISLENEFRWLLYQIKRQHNLIREYASIKDLVEKKVLHGLYDEALDLINKSNKDFGFSIWSIEMKLLIYYTDSDAKVLDFISEINKSQKGKKSGFVSYLTYLLYKRSNPKVSVYDFDTELADFDKRFTTSFEKDKFNYFRFRLDFYEHQSTECFPGVMVMEATNALIDRYDILVNILRAGFVNDPDNRDLYLKYAQLIYKLSGDIRLINIVSFEDQSIEGYYNKSFIHILDAYYTGNYNDCMELCKAYLLSDPCSMDVLKIYCRSLLFLQIPYTPIIPQRECLLDKIGNLMVKIMQGENLEKNIYSLYQVFKNVNGMFVANGLYRFLKCEKNVKYNRYFDAISSHYFDPYVTILFSNKKDRIEFINQGLKKFPNSKALLYLKERYEGRLCNDSSIAAYIRNVDNARVRYDQKEFDLSIALLKQVINDYPQQVPIIQTAVKYIFNCFNKKDDYNQAIAYYTEMFLKNESYVAKVDTSELSEKLHAKRFNGLRLNLDLLIFMLVSDQTDTARSVILERYCRYKEVDSVSQLIPFFKYEDKRKVEKFACALIISDVLRHTNLVDSVKQNLEVSQELIQYILSNNPIDKGFVSKLYEKIVEELIAYKGLRKMDNSRIYANIKAIMSYELQDVPQLYEQFINLYSLSGKGYLLVSKIRDDGTTDIMAQPVQLTDSSIYGSSNQLFMKIMIPFLKSKFGLGTYLSTRIRHGVFESNLQMVFLEEKLMLQLENGSYVLDTYWRIRFGLSLQENEKLMSTLVSFSKSVNDLISNFKQNVLQIRLTDQDKGLFDYRLSEQEICMAVVDASEKSSDYETFCYAIIQYLWQVTNRNLTEIRNKIENDLHSSFYRLLDRLEIVTAEITNPEFKDYFISAIAKSRGRIDSQLKQILHWFYVQDCNFDDFCVGDYLNIVWGIIQKTHPGVNCRIVQNSFPRITLSGEYCIHFSDLFRIFLTNMVEHSRKERYREFILNITINESGILKMHFENDFEGNEEVCNKHFSTLLNSYDRLQKEGGSGLVKARKIVKYDLCDISNEVTMEVRNQKCYADVTINTSKLCPKINY